MHSLHLRWVDYFQNTKAAMSTPHCAFPRAARLIITEDDPLVFQCLPEFSFAYLVEIFCNHISDRNNVKPVVEKLRQQGVHVLEDRIIQLQNKSYTELVSEREHIASTTIPKFNDLFAEFNIILDEISSANTDGIPKDVLNCLHRKILQEKLSVTDEKKILFYEKLLLTIQSISYIFSTCNREAFNSIMKLGLCTEDQLWDLRKSLNQS